MEIANEIGNFIGNQRYKIYMSARNCEKDEQILTLMRVIEDLVVLSKKSEQIMYTLAENENMDIETLIANS